MPRVKKLAQRVQLDEWAVVPCHPDPFLAPEIAGIALVGRVTGHPRKADGELVQTSQIASAIGRIVRTKSGTRYMLGEPSEPYRAWLKEHRPDWDPKNPIVVKKPLPDESLRKLGVIYSKKKKPRPRA